MKEIYKGYTIEVEEDGDLMDDSEGNPIPGSKAWCYMIFEGTEPDANMEEIVDAEFGDESAECALSNAKAWLDSFIEGKESKMPESTDPFEKLYSRSKVFHLPTKISREEISEYCNRPEILNFPDEKVEELLSEVSDSMMDLLWDTIRIVIDEMKDEG